MDLSFGVTVIPSVSERSDPVAEARHAEELGFDLVTVWDHLHGDRPSFETWTLLTWIAASTSSISVGPNVLGLPYRNPVVTAKMAETLHRLSGGRLVLGLGAGGNDQEFEAFGLPVRSPREKIEALEEAVTIIRGVWFAPSFSFEGRHYRTVGAEVEPKPSRAIPIWLGTYGRRALELTGRAADGWIPSMAYAPPDVAREKLKVVKESAERVGRDPETLTCAYNVSVRVGGGGPPPDPDRMVAGEPGAVGERLAGLAADGFTCFNVWLSGDRWEQRERLAKDVVPAVRELAR
jgi:alkanesulfonate monooxygenase SsuD/methylene tetrahydromethanopterin reductase-like flavin-dependent oxidoreductase (luciferase family)